MLRIVYSDGPQGSNLDLKLQVHATRLTRITSINRTEEYDWKHSFNDVELQQLLPYVPLLQKLLFVRKG